MLLGLIRSLQRHAADQGTIAVQIDELHSCLTGLSESEVELLEEAELILTPDLTRDWCCESSVE